MKRPNILFVSTDQQRFDALGANGNAEIHTPNLDRLAGGGVNFANCHVQSPICSPSRMSFLTGRYPSALGVTDNGIELPADVPTLATMLGEAGYYCGQIGKLHFLPHSKRDHKGPHPAYGFDHAEISDEPGCYDDVYRDWVHAKAPDQMDHLSVGLPPAAIDWREQRGIVETIHHPPRIEDRPIAFPGRSDVTHAEFVADRTIEFLKAHAAETFLCVSGFYAPHAPWVVPQEFLDLYNPAELTLPEFPPEIEAVRAERGFDDDKLRKARQGYYGAVSEVDHHLGRILDCLDDLGIAEETIVVFVSDHGDWMGEHLMFGKGYPCDPCISHVPLIVRYPDGPCGRRVDDLVEAIDIVPTLLDLAGVGLHEQLQGQRLAICKLADQPRTSVLTEGDGWKSLLTARFRYLTHQDGRECLYDLDAKFGDYHDVAAEPDYADALTELRAELDRRYVEPGEPLEKIAPY